MIYKNWLKLWLDNYVKPSAKVRTYERYSQIVRTHIVDSIGAKEISELTPIALQTFISDLLTTGNTKTGKGLSANFVNTVISVIQNSLKTAYMVGVSAEYVANKIKRPQTKEKQVDCFSLSEQKIMQEESISQPFSLPVYVVFAFISEKS